MTDHPLPLRQQHRMRLVVHLTAGLLLVMLVLSSHVCRALPSKASSSRAQRPQLFLPSSWPQMLKQKRQARRKRRKKKKDFKRFRGLPRYKRLRYNRRAMRQLRRLYRRTRSRRQRSILGGLHWLISFIDNDHHFEYVFGDFVRLMDILTQPGQHRGTSRLAKRLLRDSVRRVRRRLVRVYSPDIPGRSSFIQILPILARHKLLRSRDLTFYKKRFPHQESHPYITTFEEALKGREFEKLSEYLSFATALHQSIQSKRYKRLVLPPDRFAAYFKGLKDFNFRYRFRKTSSRFHRQSFFATRVVITAHHYGHRSKKLSYKILKLTHKYLRKQLYNIRHKLDDLNLLAETAYSLKLLRQGNLLSIQEADRYLVSQQRHTGAWGTEEDFQSGPYDAIRPTWLAIATLSFPYKRSLPLARPKKKVRQRRRRRTRRKQRYRKRYKGRRYKQRSRRRNKRRAKVRSKRRSRTRTRKKRRRARSSRRRKRRTRQKKRRTRRRKGRVTIKKRRSRSGKRRRRTRRKRRSRRSLSRRKNRP